MFVAIYWFWMFFAVPEMLLLVMCSIQINFVLKINIHLVNKISFVY